MWLNKINTSKSISRILGIQNKIINATKNINVKLYVDFQMLPILRYTKMATFLNR